MCLYKIIKKFDPYYSDDDTYGYKIFIYKKNTLFTPYTFGEYRFGCWYHDEKNTDLDVLEKLYYNPLTYGYQPEDNYMRHYNSGYHCYIDLKDASKKLEEIGNNHKIKKSRNDRLSNLLNSMGYNKLGIKDYQFVIVKVKLKNIVTIGYEEFKSFFKRKLKVIVAKDMYIYCNPGIIEGTDDKKKKKFIFF